MVEPAQAPWTVAGKRGWVREQRRPGGREGVRFRAEAELLLRVLYFFIA